MNDKEKLELLSLLIRYINEDKFLTWETRMISGFVGCDTIKYIDIIGDVIE